MLVFTICPIARQGFRAFPDVNKPIPVSLICAKAAVSVLGETGIFFFLSVFDHI